MRTKLVILILFLLLFILLRGFSKYQSLRQKENKIDKQIEMLTKENLTLKEEKEKLENDPFYLESAAREKMGLVKKGEVIYKIVEEE